MKSPQKLTAKNKARFEKYECFIERVIDGDSYVATKTRIFKSGKKLTITTCEKIKIRLLGVDTPETRGKKKTKAGLEAKKYVKDLLLLKSFNYYYSGATDSFGRELGDIEVSKNKMLSDRYNSAK